MFSGFQIRRFQNPLKPLSVRLGLYDTMTISVLVFELRDKTSEDVSGLGNPNSISSGDFEQASLPGAFKSPTHARVVSLSRNISKFAATSPALHGRAPFAKGFLCNALLF